MTYQYFDTQNKKKEKPVQLYNLDLQVMSSLCLLRCYIFEFHSFVCSCSVKKKHEYLALYVRAYLICMKSEKKKHKRYLKNKWGGMI